MAELRETRLCGACKLVTADPDCPLCDQETLPHPEVQTLRESEYCCDCGGEFPVSELVVKTWRDDPYQQLDDGTLITQCRACEQEEQIAFEDE